jgi:acyl transferase domain-containing protein/NAD(P)H-dependent flavin oxidoreductase YrpB (nitropropane dioxygenase family)/NADP-dependent 3-hydroxy acid dehydrogenase YdfG
MSIQVFASSLPGFPSVRLLRAAHYAGAIAVAALEYATADERQQVLDGLIRSDVSFTASVAALDDPMRDRFAAAASHGLDGVIISDARRDSVRRDVEWIVQHGLCAPVEVASLREALDARDAGATQLIVKGNESGGRVGEETTLILLQAILPAVSLPVIARGGIGLHSAAACLAAGASGVWLDWHLALCDESEIPEAIAASVAAMDGSETTILGQDCGVRYRVYGRPGEAAYIELKSREERDGLGPDSDKATIDNWVDAVEAAATAKRLRLLGQDACFARDLATRFRTVGGVCDAIRRESLRQCRVAASLDTLGEASALARSHGTRFPIVQGPMTRVSDRPAFARAVADGGGLPFLALALMRQAEVGALLDATKALLGDKPWGVGILGFVPQALRVEQLAEVRRVAPPFAIIAGGRPDQARELDENGTHTYLHVPSPDLLRTFCEGGARRFVFEGRECGGHVGPRTSLVLWDSMVRVILRHLDASRDRGETYHVLFAGGVHDARSSAMVSALAAPLAERGVKVGALLGTGYLFTREAVDTGAIQEGFQQEAIACFETILLESGVGHATRCANTAFGRHFAAEKRRLVKGGGPKEQVRDALEELNLGRLRIAAKGIVRGAADSDGKPTYVNVGDEVQRREGMYMIGQVAGLRDRVCTIEELHRDVADGSTLIAAQLARLDGDVARGSRSDIAIVGLSCMLPKANSVDRFWHNVLTKFNAITEVPAERFDTNLYFDADRRARDRIYSRWGGFLDDVEFDPVRYGMPPNSVASVDPLQLLTLETARRAVEDARYTDRPFDREHTSVIVGTGGGAGELGLGYGFRSQLPHFVNRAGHPAAEAETLIGDLGGWLPEWTEDSFAGLLLNVAAGRVANRFDLGGTNYSVDAACATSLAAVRLAALELAAGDSNMVIAAGVDTLQTPFGYLCFSKTQALSPSGQCRTFDESADGIVISEGVAAAVLKRLDDAIRDGDRIYAVIKGIGASSDGRDKGLTAPRPVGQIRALERAYQHADVAPATIGLIEAHGTGTVVGDRTEIESLTSYFSARGAEVQSCALGSVKSMIGHTKCTAGFAGLVKAALALYYKVLPPTIGVTKPNSKANLSESPFYLNTEARPWLKRADGTPRRAGVSAFGFGGTNFHVVLEEYEDETAAPPALRDWPAELFVWRGDSPPEVGSAVESLAAALGNASHLRLCDLAAAVCAAYGNKRGATCLAIVAESIADLAAKLTSASKALASGEDLRDPRGVYLRCRAETPGKIAFVFPGQGSQRTNMLGDLLLAIPSFRPIFERADRAIGSALPVRLSDYVFPKPSFSDEQKKAVDAALTDTRVAQPALGAAGLAMSRWLTELGINPDMACGHSYGELAALCAAGVIVFDDLIGLSEARGRAIVEGKRDELGTMAAIDGAEDAVWAAVSDIKGVYLANVNTPSQTVLSGSAQAIDEALPRLSRNGMSGRRLPVAAAFHSPLVEGAQPIFRDALSRYQFRSPRFPVYSNTNAAPHADDPDRIKSALVEHLLRPVRFADEIRAMHDAGARIFIEAGPGKVLTGLVTQTLAGRDFTAIATDQAGRSGTVQMVHALAQIATLGVHVNLQKLFERRLDAPVVLAKLAESRPPVASPTTWTITHGRAMPSRASAKADSPAAVPARAVAPVQPAAATALAAAGERSDGRSARSEPAEQRAPARGSTSSPRARAASAEVPSGISVPAGVISIAAAPRVPNPAGASIDSSAAAALSHHHRLMAKFLETHQNVMLEYLGQPQNRHHGGRRGQEAQLVSERAESSVSPVSSVVASVVPTAASVAPVVESVAPVVASVASEPTPASETLSEDEIVERLVALVSERTGYPPEMLGLDLDLEADLGVDSIKRVEIVSALQNLGLLAGRDADMEVLSKLKTLRAIAKWIATPANGGPERAAPRQTLPEAATVSHEIVGRPFQGRQASDDRPLTRMAVAVVDAPALDEPKPLNLPGMVLITDGGGPLPTVLRERLTANGIANEIVAAADVSSSAAAKTIVDAARRKHGAVAAIVHAAPIDDRPTESDDAFLARVGREAGTLLLLAQAAESDLRETRGSVIAATALGGAFSVGTPPPGIWPGSGAVSGFIKTLAREWAEVNCKTVDFELTAPADRIADHILAELARRDEAAEVGYIGTRRVTIGAIPAPLGREPRLSIDRESVILVTGGARGITADVARELAERFQPTLLIAGRSPFPGASEPAELAACGDARAVKAHLIAQRRGTGTIAPAEIEAECRRILQARDVRATIAALKETGATVEYHAVDVADAAAFGSLLDDVLARFGRIDGVVHGAGIIEDKLVRDKTIESFERVLRPKVAGALTLMAKLRPDTLKFLVFFSSVSARFGNRGQCDYAAANEVLNKLAASWRSCNARVVSINWGPWESSGGMVSAELAQRFADAGVRLISRPQGRKAFVDELLYGDGADREVLWGDRLPEPDESTVTVVAGQRSSAAYPLLGSVDRGKYVDRGSAQPLQLQLDTSPSIDVYLHDHMLDGVPVMPMMVAVELMAEAALVRRGGVCTSVSDVRVLQGITYPGFDARTLRIAATDTPDRADAVNVSIASTALHYRSVVTCGAGLEAPPRLDPIRLVDARPLELSIDEAYQRWLFHGARFAGVTRVEAVGQNGIIGRVCTSAPSPMLGRSAPGAWLVDPLAMDSGLQLVILWARTCLDQTPLPSRLRACRRFAAVLPPELVCEALVEQRPSRTSATLVCDIRFFDADHRLLVRLEGMEATCSAALNRLSDAKVAGAGVS